MAATTPITVAVAIIGWFLIPVISFYVNKLLSYYLDFNLSRKLRELKIDIIPSLNRVLGDVTEQRIMRGARDDGKGSESDHLKNLGELDMHLKSTLCDAEDILDLIEYRRIEKKVIGSDVKSFGTRIGSGVLLQCKRSSFVEKLCQCALNQNLKLRDIGDKLQQWVLNMDLKFWDLVAKLRQYVQDLNLKFRDLVAKLEQYAQAAQYLRRNGIFRDHALRATLVQCAQTLNMYNHQGAAGPPSMPEDAPAAQFTDDIEQGLATPSSTPYVAPSNPPSPNALPNSTGSATELRGDNQHGSADEAHALLNSVGSAAEFRGDNQQGSAEEAHALPNSVGSASEFRGDNQQGSAWDLFNSLAHIAWDCLGFMFAQLCLHRDKHLKEFGFMNDDDTDCVLSINERISFRERIKNIEYTISDTKKSPLLNQSSSSFTAKNSAKESSSEQKEIDDMHRNIEQKVFGREEHRAQISRMLREGLGTNAASSSTSKSYSVIGIYGITGSGKSTLAQYVCDYEKDAGHFKVIMFILVGKSFSIRDIFRVMLDQIKKQQDRNSLKTELKDLQSLKAELEKELNGKRFLLVLDNIWVNADNKIEREILLHALDAGQSGSRILVTAQKKDAAAALGAQGQMNMPIPDLEEEQYLSMFMHNALEVSQVTSTDYEKYKAIGRKFTEKLRRSPIAAITVAAQLKKYSTIDEWKTAATHDMLNETMGALWWSYQQLGVDLRRCFAYCSTFPKGYTLKRDELVWIWIAQGFINTGSNTTDGLEDVGQRCFHELLTFSILQAERKPFFLKTEETFTIHDLLHDLAERVSGSDFSRIGLNEPKDIRQGVHHVFIQTKNIADINEKTLDLGNLRTLIINEDPYEEPQNKSMERNYDLEEVTGRLFMRLKKLRVLIIKLNFTTDFSVPASIGQMKHLRYLAFHFSSHFFYLILPSTFSKLYHIQTIDIPCEEASCPENMANLSNLRQFSRWLSFPNIGRLRSLRTLEEFSVKKIQGYGLKQLKHLNKLRGTLSIEGLEIVQSKEEALEAHLMHKEQLRELELKFIFKGRLLLRRSLKAPQLKFDRPKCNRGDPDVVAEVLEGLCPPKNLEDLSIRDYQGSRYPSWMLSCHHQDTPKQLLKLELTRCSQLASIPEDSVLFKGLRQLNIFGCDWDRLPQNMERLVSLETLEIRYCDNIEFLPMLLNQSLQTIRIVHCHVLSETCKEIGHQNWLMIEHIPLKAIF